MALSDTIRPRPTGASDVQPLLAQSSLDTLRDWSYFEFRIRDAVRAHLDAMGEKPGAAEATAHLAARIVVALERRDIPRPTDSRRSKPTYAEIAAHLGSSERSVRRAAAALKTAPIDWQM